MAFKISKEAWIRANQTRASSWLSEVAHPNNWNSKHVLWAVYSGVYNTLFSEGSMSVDGNSPIKSKRVS